MIGETWWWYRLASHLSMPVQQVKQMTSSSDFINWMVYLEEEPNKFNALYFYLAQIAAEVRRSFIKHPDKVKTKNFIIKFIKIVDKKSSNVKKAKQSKSTWLRWLGIDRKKKDG